VQKDSRFVRTAATNRSAQPLVLHWLPSIIARGADDCMGHQATTMQQALLLQHDKKNAGLAKCTETTTHVPYMCSTLSSSCQSCLIAESAVAEITATSPNSQPNHQRYNHTANPQSSYLSHTPACNSSAFCQQVRPITRPTPQLVCICSLHTHLPRAAQASPGRLGCQQQQPHYPPSP
jgi:hypothetical protein